MDPARAASALAVLAALGAFLRWVWPKWRAFFRKVDAGLTSVIGHEEILDPANGRILAPARPGLGRWMASTDDALAVLSTAVSALAEQHSRLDTVERRIGQHDQRLTLLEDARIERMVARADSAAAFDAMGRVVDGEPSDDPDLG